MRRYIFRLLLVIFSFVFAITLVEILLRVFTPEPENLAKLKSSDLFLYENKPHAQLFHTDKSEGYSVYSNINSDGFRDDEFKPEKDSGTLRVAVLGDSFEEALQVDLVDTWQKVLQRKLKNDLQKPVEVYNFGVSGYGTDQEWLTLREKVWRFKPDIVVLAFTANDIGDVYKNKLVVLQDDQLKVRTLSDREGGNWLGKIVRQSYIYQLLVRVGSASDFGKRVVDKFRVKILGFPSQDKFFLSDAQLVQGPFEVVASEKNPPAEVTSSWQVIDKLLLDMKRQADEHGAGFVVTLNVAKMQVLQSEWDNLRKQYSLEGVDASPDTIASVLGDFMKNSSIYYYNPTEDAKIWYGQKGDLHYRQDAHFNKNGHEFMGEKLGEFLEKNNLVNVNQ